MTQQRVNYVLNLYGSIKRKTERYFNAGSPEWLKESIGEEIEYVNNLLHECLTSHRSTDLRKHYTDLIIDLDYRLKAI